MRFFIKSHFRDNFGSGFFTVAQGDIMCTLGHQENTLYFDTRVQAEKFLADNPKDASWQIAECNL